MAAATEKCVEFSNNQKLAEAEMSFGMGGGKIGSSLQNAGFEIMRGSLVAVPPPMGGIGFSLVAIPLPAVFELVVPPHEDLKRTFNHLLLHPRQNH